ncbi:MAG: 4-hydroxybenzoate octaprenyltransferase [Candidatus Accumulibacter sp.]|jgi:4-hydroxybenzoate polyprenyltransferase|nr:4-hydroxybenzoate octaprenyltransferase [Accumulibacter sp.]
MKNTQRIVERLNQYERLMRLDKPIGILLLLWPTLWALWISSDGSPDMMVVWIFILGAVLMRSAGCVMNDLADSGFDPHVARTRDRPIAAGNVSKKEAMLLCVVLLGMSLSLVLCFKSFRMLALSVIAFLLAATYPLTKRFLSIPQACLGVALGFGIPMAYAAHMNVFPRECWYLLAVNVFWALAYDTEYAMADREDDLKIGIKTSAITFGRFDVSFVMSCYAIMFGLLIWAGGALRRGWLFYAGVGVAAAIAAYHFTLIRDRKPEKCFKAFLHNNWIGASVFSGIALDYLRQSYFS